jgi:transcriptional regulator with XRE-family HTH domain
MKITGNQILPNLFRKYRKGRGLKQKQVALILGLKSASVISRWEKGINIPKTLNVLKLAAIYRTMTEMLLPKLTTMLRIELRKREEDLRKSS